MTAWTPEDFAKEIGAFRRTVSGLIRRMVVSITDGGIWQMLGHKLIDPTQRETRDVELYPGIGHYARPPSNTGNAEAVVVNIGDQNNPAIVATRDEATRAACVNDITDDETVDYNSASRVYVKADGTIEARTHGGTANQLALKSAIDGFYSILNTWTPVPNDGGAALKAAFTAYVGAHVTWPASTTKLKGE